MELLGPTAYPAADCLLPHFSLTAEVAFSSIVGHITVPRHWCTW